MKASCFTTRIGRLCVAWRENKVYLIARPELFWRKAGSITPSPPGGFPLELAEYLRGARRNFSIVPVYPRSGFAGKVLEIVSRIPYGETKTYGEVAEMAGRPGAARAVGAVLRSNPVPFLVPCHRVVGKEGIGGYGLGVWVKAILLKIERAGFIPSPLSPRQVHIS